MSDPDPMARTLDDLVADGYAEVVGMNEKGMPLYSLTDKGRIHATKVIADNDEAAAMGGRLSLKSLIDQLKTQDDFAAFGRFMQRAYEEGWYVFPKAKNPPKDPRL